MRRIRRAIKSANSAALPAAVWARAHAEYPAAVAREGLYAVAFFGHAPMPGTVRSTESVWRGCIRRALAATLTARD